MRTPGAILKIAHPGTGAFDGRRRQVTERKKQKFGLVREFRPITWSKPWPDLLSSLPKLIIKLISASKAWRKHGLNSIAIFN
jgi:hypothetical protein